MWSQYLLFICRKQGRCIIPGGTDRLLLKSKKEVFLMDKSHCNKAIRCTVDQCANHSSGAEYCALDCITVGTHEANPTVDQCTDCKSFQRKA